MRPLNIRAGALLFLAKSGSVPVHAFLAVAGAGRIVTADHTCKTYCANITVFDDAGGTTFSALRRLVAVARRIGASIVFERYETFTATLRSSKRLCF